MINDVNSRLNEFKKNQEEEISKLKKVQHQELLASINKLEK